MTTPIFFKKQKDAFEYAEQNNDRHLLRYGNHPFLGLLRSLKKREDRCHYIQYQIRLNNKLRFEDYEFGNYQQMPLQSE